MRRIAAILEHPRTDEEGRFADEHIRSECEQTSRATWGSGTESRRGEVMGHRAAAGAGDRRFRRWSAEGGGGGRDGSRRPDTCLAGRRNTSRGTAPQTRPPARSNRSAAGVGGTTSMATRGRTTMGGGWTPTSPSRQPRSARRGPRRIDGPEPRPPGPPTGRQGDHGGRDP